MTGNTVLAIVDISFFILLGFVIWLGCPPQPKE
jgi:hypothetical protein